MKNKRESIDALNQLLQGEHMAVDVFNTFISKLDNNRYKKTFQEVQNNHRENISYLAKYIQNLDGKPHENIGMKGTVADMKLMMELGMAAKDQKILEKAIEGEVVGINMAEKVLRGKLDNKSRRIAGEILERDRSSLEQLNRLN